MLMIKTICKCDRCKKEFPAKNAKRIVFEDTLEKQETVSRIIEVFVKMFPNPPRDYCPECVSEIKEFMKRKEGSSDENCIDKHKSEVVEADSFGKETGRDQEDGAGGN